MTSAILVVIKIDFYGNEGQWIPAAFFAAVFFKFLCGLSSLKKKTNRSNELFKKYYAGWIEMFRDMENITPTDENQSIDIAYSKNIDLTECTLSKGL